MQHLVLSVFGTMEGTGTVGSGTMKAGLPNGSWSQGGDVATAAQGKKSRNNLYAPIFLLISHQGLSLARSSQYQISERTRDLVLLVIPLWENRVGRGREWFCKQASGSDKIQCYLFIEEAYGFTCMFREVVIQMCFLL